MAIVGFLATFEKSHRKFLVFWTARPFGPKYCVNQVQGFPVDSLIDYNELVTYGITIQNRDMKQSVR